MTTPHPEDTLIERPAIALFRQLGWETANCFDEVFSDNGGTITARQLFGGQQRRIQSPPRGCGTAKDLCLHLADESAHNILPDVNLGKCGTINP